MKKYFVVSDIHGFYNELIRDLKNAGWDDNNPNHILISCGDIFDRGRQPLEVYNFLRSIPKERRILIRGNHEILLKEMYNKCYAESHDKVNGTYQTAIDISDELEDKEFELRLKEKFFNEKVEPEFNDKGYTEEYQEYRDLLLNESKLRNHRIFKNKKLKEILDWIDSGEWVNYYETKNYIFVHSWIPVQHHIDFEKSMWIGYFVKSSPDSYREDWRNATQQEWDDAMWPCPWKNAQLGLNQTGKTIVCGHWHTSDFFNNLKNKNSTKKYDINNNPIYKSKRYKLIGLDTCTVVTKKINVFTFEE